MARLKKNIPSRFRRTMGKVSTPNKYGISLKNLLIFPYKRIEL